MKLILFYSIISLNWSDWESKLESQHLLRTWLTTGPHTTGQAYNLVLVVSMAYTILLEKLVVVMLKEFANSVLADCFPGRARRTEDMKSGESSSVHILRIIIFKIIIQTIWRMYFMQSLLDVWLSKRSNVKSKHIVQLNTSCHAYKQILVTSSSVSSFQILK